MSELSLDPRTTTLVVIDLQRGIVARQSRPHAAAEVVARSARLADRFRELGATVVLVNVAFAADKRDLLTPPVDLPNPPAQLPSDWSQIVPEIGPCEATSSSPSTTGARSYGTELDLQLRRRGVRTIVLCGIATNFGVESTARDGWERSYEIVFARMR